MTLLIVFRIIASLGIGGEWAAGASMVAEVVPEGTALARSRDVAASLSRGTERATVARAKAMVRFGATAPDRTGRYIAYLLDEMQTSSEAFTAGVSGFGSKA